MAKVEAASLYDADCRRCARLSEFLDETAQAHPDYFCRPVPAFGDDRPRLLVVGLAPGLHGANRTGRPFTGDACSDLLYGTLHRLGLASAKRSVARDDGLLLYGCRITNAVKCLPPANKPTGAEVRQCGAFLHAEIEALKPTVIVCLGAVSHDAVLRSLNLKERGASSAEFKFAHGAEHAMGDVLGAPEWLVDSYHPSRYNVNTGRLTEEMFFEALSRATRLAGVGHV
jgi:uracil-DNA glycosylase family 4